VVDFPEIQDFFEELKKKHFRSKMYVYFLMMAVYLLSLSLQQPLTR